MSEAAVALPTMNAVPVALVLTTLNPKPNRLSCDRSSVASDVESCTGPNEAEKPDTPEATALLIRNVVLPAREPSRFKVPTFVNEFCVRSYTTGPLGLPGKPGRGRLVFSEIWEMPVKAAVGFQFATVSLETKVDPEP